MGLIFEDAVTFVGTIEIMLVWQVLTFKYRFIDTDSSIRYYAVKSRGRNKKYNVLVRLIVHRLSC